MCGVDQGVYDSCEPWEGAVKTAAAVILSPPAYLTLSPLPLPLKRSCQPILRVKHCHMCVHATLVMVRCHEGAALACGRGRPPGHGQSGGDRPSVLSPCYQLRGLLVRGGERWWLRGQIKNKMLDFERNTRGILKVASRETFNKCFVRGRGHCNKSHRHMERLESRESCDAESLDALLWIYQTVLLTGDVVIILIQSKRLPYNNNLCLHKKIIQCPWWISGLFTVTGRTSFLWSYAQSWWS